MSWLTKLSLRNRSIVALIVVAVVLLGVYGIRSLKEELIPDLTFPYLTVVTIVPGASASDVDATVTTPIEQAIRATSDIKEYTSYSNEGMSITTIEYEFGTDMAAKQADVQAAVAAVQSALPENALESKVAALNINSLPVVQLAVSSDLPPRELAELLTTAVVPRLQEIDGVQAVTVSGAQERQLQIRLDPAKVLRLGVPLEGITTAITTANLTTGAGTVTSGSLVYPVTVRAEATTVAAFRDLVVATDDGNVKLGDIADVRILAKKPTAVTRTNGAESVGVSVVKTSDANTVDVANAVTDTIADLDQKLGDKVTLTTVLDQSTFIEESIASLWREGLIGAVFAVLVIWLFLHSWRSTLIAGLSIPLSIIAALALLWWRGESLNVLTLGGLTIAIGRVIDDSIVVIENAHRHLQEGDDVHAAAYGATREVARAITASTLTTVAVFLPLGFLHGLASEFFRPFAITVTFALLASLLVALTVVPVVATFVLSKGHVGHRDPAEVTRLQRLYLPVLKLAIDHKAMTLVAAVAIFVATMAGTTLLKTNLFDTSAAPTMSIDQKMPPGTSLDATLAAATKVEDVLADTRGIDIYQMTAGSTGSLFGAGGGIGASASSAVFTVQLDPEADKLAVIEDLRTRVADLQGIGEVTVRGEDASMGDMTAIEVRVTATDPAVLKKANDIALAAVKSVPVLADVSSNLSEGQPSATVTVDQAKAAAAGVDVTTLSRFSTLILNGFPLGSVPTEEGVLPAQLSVGEITLPPIPGAVTAMLERLSVPAAQGMVGLGDIATVEETMTPVQVTRVDSARTATITGAPTNNNIGAASTDTEAALAKVDLPDGATWEIAGAKTVMDEAFRTLGIAMVIAVLIVYVIMVVTFRSLLNPLILLVSIPFAVVGAVILMLVTGTSLGMPSLVGALMLIGIVVTNAIVLLDLVEQFRRRGMDARTAVIEGGRRRLRPILMTAVATILALLPMSLGLGESAFLSTPLAVVVIGGLFTSTILTLILVPVLYLALDKLRRRGPEEDWTIGTTLSD